MNLKERVTKAGLMQKEHGPYNKQVFGRWLRDIRKGRPISKMAETCVLFILDSKESELVLAEKLDGLVGGLGDLQYRRTGKYIVLSFSGFHWRVPKSTGMDSKCLFDGEEIDLGIFEEVKLRINKQ